MNTSKNKILVWAVVLLLIANVAVLATIWLQHNKQRPERGTPADFLIKELALNNEQQDKLHNLAREHRQKAEEIREKIKNGRYELFKLLRQPDVSDSIKKTASANVAKDLEQLDLLTFNHFQQVRNICNPQQQKKFDQVIEEVLLMMAGGPPPGGPGRRNGDHMPPPEH